MAPDDPGDELYALAPERFVARRDALAKELAAAGDRTGAGVVRALGRPSRSAWLANLLVRRHPNDVDDLLTVGRGLAAAHEERSGQRVRDLSARRQAAVRALVALARAEAEAAGHAMSAPVQRELESTLEAATADDASAAQLRSARLTSTLTHVGFGSFVADSPLGAEAPARPGRTPTTAPGRGRSAVRAPASGRRGASRAAAGPTRKSEGATRPRAQEQQAERQRAERVTKARRVLHDAERALAAARVRHEAAALRRRNATRDLRVAERALERATTELRRAGDARGRAARAAVRASGI